MGVAIKAEPSASVLDPTGRSRPGVHHRKAIGEADEVALGIAFRHARSDERRQAAAPEVRAEASFRKHDPGDRTRGRVRPVLAESEELTADPSWLSSGHEAEPHSANRVVGLPRSHATLDAEPFVCGLPIAGKNHLPCRRTARHEAELATGEVIFKPVLQQLIEASQFARTWDQLSSLDRLLHAQHP